MHFYINVAFTKSLYRVITLLQCTAFLVTATVTATFTFFFFNQLVSFCGCLQVLENTFTLKIKILITFTVISSSLTVTFFSYFFKVLSTFCGEKRPPSSLVSIMKLRLLLKCYFFRNVHRAQLLFSATLCCTFIQLHTFTPGSCKNIQSHQLLATKQLCWSEWESNTLYEAAWQPLQAFSNFLVTNQLL